MRCSGWGATVRHSMDKEIVHQSICDTEHATSSQLNEAELATVLSPLMTEWKPICLCLFAKFSGACATRLCHAQERQLTKEDQFLSLGSWKRRCNLVFHGRLSVRKRNGLYITSQMRTDSSSGTLERICGQFRSLRIHRSRFVLVHKKKED